jgi:hypothetical protein
MFLSDYGCARRRQSPIIGQHCGATPGTALKWANDWLRPGRAANAPHPSISVLLSLHCTCAASQYMLSAILVNDTLVRDHGLAAAILLKEVSGDRL